METRVDDVAGERIYRKKKEIISRDIAGETILVPIRSKLADMHEIFSLNPVAAFVWTQIDGQKNLARIIGEVFDRFDVERDQAEPDVKDFVDELLRRDLIEVVG